MIRSTKDLHRVAIDATDGSIGSVTDLLFDDDRWTIRYFVVKTGGWLSSRKVLITPAVIEQLDLDRDRLGVTLTREQVKNSPDIDTDKPVSRQHEMAYYNYYGLGYYWAGPFMGAPAPLVQPIVDEQLREERQRALADADPHLRSVREVTGYHIQASDGEIGHVEDVLVDEETWMLRYLVVDTRNWLPGKHVLVAPDWVDKVSWQERKVFVDLTQDAVRNSPDFRHHSLMSPEYEVDLYSHYGRSISAQRAARMGPRPQPERSR